MTTKETEAFAGMLAIGAVIIGMVALGEPIGPGCHCDICDPRMHADCSADCRVWDCTSSWACCNGDCDDRPA